MMMPPRFCIHYVSKSGRPSKSGHRTGKGQSSSQFPRRVLPKNVLTIRQLYSSPLLVWTCLKSCMLGLSIMQIKKFQMSKKGLEKEEELEIKLPTFAGLKRNQGNFKENIYLCFIDYVKIFDCVDHDKLWKALTCLLRNLHAGQEATVRSLHGTTDWFKSRKEYDRAVYCHLICLIYILSTS